MKFANNIWIFMHKWDLQLDKNIFSTGRWEDLLKRLAYM